MSYKNSSYHERWLSNKKSCKYKRKYRSQYWASVVLKRVRRKYKDNNNLNIYLCLNCNFWHLGNDFIGSNNYEL